MAAVKQQVNTLWIALLRMSVGVAFLTLGLNKTQWIWSHERLLKSLQAYLERATYNEWYLAVVAIPYCQMWAKCIVLGELAIGISMVLGLFSRFSIPIAFFLVLNYHFTTGLLFQWSFLSNTSGLLLLTAVLALWGLQAGKYHSVGSLLDSKKLKLW